MKLHDGPGSYSFYINRHCRCEECMQAKRDYRNDLNRRTREMRTAVEELRRRKAER